MGWDEIVGLISLAVMVIMQMIGVKKFDDSSYMVKLPKKLEDYTPAERAKLIEDLEFRALYTARQNRVTDALRPPP